MVVCDDRSNIDAKYFVAGAQAGSQVPVPAIVRAKAETRAPGSRDSCDSGVGVRRCLFAEPAARPAPGPDGNRITAVIMLIFLHVICLVPGPGRRPDGGQAAPRPAGRKRPTASLLRQNPGGAGTAVRAQ